MNAPVVDLIQKFFTARERMAFGGALLVSHKQARLKPCLRCGYSLINIAGARNCPECGLAVRISLSGNSNLEWTNSRWQYWLAAAFALMIVGVLCRTLGSAGQWVIHFSIVTHHRLGPNALRICYWLSTALRDLWPIVSGLAMCLLAKPERRYPDKSRASRMLMLAAGLWLILLSSVKLMVRYELLSPPTGWVGYLFWRAASDPWPSLVLGVLTCGFALELARRGTSRMLLKMFQLPLWPIAMGTVIWLFNIQQFFWPLGSIVWEWLFPLSMIVMLTVTIRVLVRGAREARLNWVTDQ